MPTERPRNRNRARVGQADWERLLARNQRRLLAVEKRRRGMERDRLVFAGMHIVADIWWCAARAVRKAREREAAFFQAYLHDRIAYSLELGRIRQLPRRIEDWLRIGADVTPADIDLLLERRRRRQRPHTDTAAQERDGVLYVDPTLPEDKKEFCADWAARMGWKVADASENPRLWDAMIQERQRENYPTVRWNFPWEQYVLVGVPDGLTDRLVYEFRIARAEFVAERFVRPVAMAQGDLYGRFFGRAIKRVQVYASSTGRTYTYEEPVDTARAIDTLRTFQAVDAGRPAQPPAAWKCAPSRCGYFESCTLRARRGQ